MNVAARPTHLTPIHSKPAPLKGSGATTVAAFVGSVGMAGANVVEWAIPFQTVAETTARMQKLNRGRGMAVMSFVSTAAHTYGAISDFRQGRAVKGSVQALSAVASASIATHVVTGGRLMGRAMVPALAVVGIGALANFVMTVSESG